MAETQTSDDTHEKSIDIARRLFESEDAYRQALAQASPPTAGMPFVPELRTELLSLLPTPDANTRVEGLAPPPGQKYDPPTASNHRYDELSPPPMPPPIASERVEGVPPPPMPPPLLSQRVEGLAPPPGQHYDPPTESSHRYDELPPLTEDAPTPQRSLREIYESKIRTAIADAMRGQTEPVLDGKPLFQALAEIDALADRPRLKSLLIEYAQTAMQTDPNEEDLTSDTSDISNKDDVYA